MSKAILVVDLPSNCAECQFCGFGGKNLEKYVCCLTKEHSEGPHLIGCPLKPIHALKSCGHDYIIYERQYLYKNLEREYELMKGARVFDEKCKSIVKEELIERMEHPERYAKR